MLDEDRQYIEVQLARLREAAGLRDFEAAHAIEDALFASVLQFIADGHPEPEKMAALALTSADIRFERGCA
jgi:hypothetical protein